MTQIAFTPYGALGIFLRHRLIATYLIYGHLYHIVSVAEWLWRVTQAIRLAIVSSFNEVSSHGLCPQGFESPR
jgi:hypothetical protein